MSVKSKVQSVLMPKTMSQEDREEWLSEHNFKVRFGSKKGPYETEKFFRYRQSNPKHPETDLEEYDRTLDLNADLGIKAVVEFTKVSYKTKRQSKKQPIAPD